MHNAVALLVGNKAFKIKKQKISPFMKGWLFIYKGWLAIDKQKPLSLFISPLLMLKRAFDNEKWKWFKLINN